MQDKLGYPSGGSRISPWGGAEPLGRCQPLTWVLFGKNVCENERIGSCWGEGGMHWWHPPGSANVSFKTFIFLSCESMPKGKYICPQNHRGLRWNIYLGTF